MNYRPVNLKQINYDEFIPRAFEQQNPKFKWIEIQVKFFFFFDKSREIKEIFIIKNKIFKMIRQVLII